MGAYLTGSHEALPNDMVVVTSPPGCPSRGVGPGRPPFLKKIFILVLFYIRYMIVCMCWLSLSHYHFRGPHDHPSDRRRQVLDQVRCLQ